MRVTPLAASRKLTLTGVLLLALVAAPVAQGDYDDPSGRVARLNHSQGEISYSPAGEDDWIGVTRNLPLSRGDRFWTDRDGRAEFQVGNAAVRLGPRTGFEILELDDDYAQMRLTEGTVNLRVRSMYPGQVFEIATPTLSFTISRAGRYRIDVEPNGDIITTVVVWEGAGEVHGEDESYQLRAGDTVRFYGRDLRDHEMYGLPRTDDFDRYCLDRDQRLDRSASLRYLDDDIVGYSDLDEYGDWRQVRNLGVVWFPRRVDRDWAPYRDGHWAWHEPWGWTWIDDAPWGFAPSHYGRWAHVQNRWGWIPGPRHVRSIYSPALVVFVGGSGWSLSLSSGNSSPIGWFPLGPRDVYVPSYRTSRDYFTRINVNNTVINNTTITNVYNNYASGDINVRQVNYVNRRVEGAVTAVPTDVFVNSKSVRPARIRVDSRTTENGEIKRAAVVAPTRRSVRGTATAANVRPPRESIERPVIARKAPLPAPRPFAAREPQLQRTPGRAAEVDPAEAVPEREASAARKVRVVSGKRAAADVRESAPQGADRESAPEATPPATLQPLDRSARPAKERGRQKATDDRDSRKPAEPEAQPRSERQDQAPQPRLAAAERRLAECLAAAQRRGRSQSQEDELKCRQKYEQAVAEVPETAHKP